MGKMDERTMVRCQQCGEPREVGYHTLRLIAKGRSLLCKPCAGANRKTGKIAHCIKCNAELGYRRASALKRSKYDEGLMCFQCRNEDVGLASRTRGGLSRTHLGIYNSWRDMVARCDDAEHKEYRNYGARGIRVCREWYDAEVFAAWALANGWEKGLTIERIDVNGNYGPDNCKWIPRNEQPANQRKTLLITYDGETLPARQWDIRMGYSHGTVRHRIKAGWPVEEAINGRSK